MKHFPYFDGHSESFSHYMQYNSSTIPFHDGCHYDWFLKISAITSCSDTEKRFP